MTDIHSHILYGIDDGAANLQISKQMLQHAKSAGIDRIVATPHARKSNFDLALATQRFVEIADLAKWQGLQLDLGFEVHWNLLVSIDPAEYTDYCFQGTKYILIEFSLLADDLPNGHDRMLYSLQRSGLKIIIAHPERYRFVQRDIDNAKRWRDMGCLLQLDANCLLRAYEPQSKHTARKLFKAGLYDIHASDAHCAEDYDLYAKAVAWMEKRE